MLRTVTLTFALAATLSACASPQEGRPSSNVSTADKGEKSTFSTIDGLLYAQARDLAQRMGWIDATKVTTDNQGSRAKPFKDYDVEVYRGGPAVGSLLQGSYGNLLNRSDCPAGNVAKTAINAFGSHQIDIKNALKIGLPVLPVGIDGNYDTTTSYSLEDAELQLLDQDELDNLVKSASCKARIGRAVGPVWIVRGIITAKRSYKFYRLIKGGATLKLAGSENAASHSNSTNGEDVDSNARPYFMILSPVKDDPKGASTPPQPAPLPNDMTAAQSPACAANFDNNIYIQRAESEPEKTGVAIRTALLKKFIVERFIDPVEVTPNVADVRYYNDGDEAAADCALAILRENGYPNARRNRRDSLKPPGTLEVWLTKR